MDKLFIVTVKPKKAFLDVHKSYFMHVYAASAAAAKRLAAEKQPEIFGDTDGVHYTNPKSRRVETGVSFEV